MGRKKRTSRATIAISLVVVLFCVFVGRLVQLQVIQGEEYEAAGQAVKIRNVLVEAARGEILDRNGNPLITNRQGNSIIFDAAYFPDPSKQAERNEIVFGLIKLFEQHGQPWIDNLPLAFDESGTIVYIENRESDIVNLKSKDYLNLNDYATAQNCLHALIERYGLQEYSQQDARKIASVCYEMWRLVFSITQPYTFAEDVPTDIVSKVKENGNFYKGVDVQIVPYREFTDGTIAPHVLGRVAAIDPDEYKELKNSGYALNDTIGKFGIEKAMEQYLRGKNGVKTITTDAKGNTTSTYSVNPLQGDTVILTIDKNLQKVTQDALKSHIVELRKKTPLEPAGAVVIIDVKTGEILACATYPSYDISTYVENQETLSKDANSPLWNRALMSTYSPGSTMKPATALAALDSGTVNKSTKITCKQVFNYGGVAFSCMHYHGPLDVVHALYESCNVYFYESGRNMGIEKMVEYYRLFGLGSKTGIEIDEAAGNLDSVEFRESIGETWLPGFTVQSAIGQAANLFTPLQLASYCATIANGGTRYQPHFVKTVKSYDYSETKLEKQATVVSETGIAKEHFDTVREGMLLVGTKGNVGYNFSKLPVKAAAKTGTAQVDKNVNGVIKRLTNGAFITFAPYEEPEIAIAIVVEGAGSGTSISGIAAKIYEYYFNNTGKLKKPQEENVLLK